MWDHFFWRKERDSLRYPSPKNSPPDCFYSRISASAAGSFESPSFQFNKKVTPLRWDHFFWQQMIILLRSVLVSHSFKSKVKLCEKFETHLANETTESGSKKVIPHRHDAKGTYLRKSMMQEPVLWIRFSLAYVPSNQLRSCLDKPYLFVPMYPHDIKEVDSPTIDGFHLS